MSTTVGRRRDVVARSCRESVLDGPGRDLGPRTNTELVPDPLDVSLGRALRDEQPLADLAVGQAGCYQRCDFALAPAQRTRTDRTLERALNEGIGDCNLHAHLRPLVPGVFTLAGPES